MGSRCVLLKAGFATTIQRSHRASSGPMGNAPDGVILIPWEGGICLTWNVYILSLTSWPYCLVSSAFETLGPINHDGMAFFNNQPWSPPYTDNCMETTAKPHYFISAYLLPSSALKQSLFTAVLSLCTASAKTDKVLGCYYSEMTSIPEKDNSQSSLSHLTLSNPEALHVLQVDNNHDT